MEAEFVEPLGDGERVHLGAVGGRVLKVDLGGMRRGDAQRVAGLHETEVVEWPVLHRDLEAALLPAPLSLFHYDAIHARQHARKLEVKRAVRLCNKTTTTTIIIKKKKRRKEKKRKRRRRRR